MPNKSTFQGLDEYIKLGVPACLMLISKWWALEVMTLITASFGVEA
jgi:hypothetical protein